jgi:hypothetical protein
VHADGYLSFESTSAYDDVNISEIRGRCNSHVDLGSYPNNLIIMNAESLLTEFYPALSYFSAYGPTFQRVTNLYFNSNEALASIRGMDGSLHK